MMIIQKYKNLTLPGKLIAINAAVYVLTQLYRLLLTLFCVHGYDWQHFLALPANLHDFLYCPWTLFTYMFVHADMGVHFFHIVFNMLWLWWFGQFFLRYHTGRQFLSVYLMGGLFAGACFLLTYNLFPYFVYERTFAHVVGASGAIFALVIAVAMRQPDDTIYLNLLFRQVGIKMKWFALIALGINLLSLNGSDNIGGIICHLGGALWGFAFGYAERRGTDLTRGFSRLGDWLANLTKPRTRTLRAERGGKRNAPTDKRMDMDYNARQQERRQRIDAILDKISKNGYDGLTAEEKQLLFDASNRKNK